MIFWLLAREVKILRGELGKNEDWDVMVDLFFYKELDKVVEAEDEDKGDDEGKPAPAKEKANWDGKGEDAEEGGDWEESWVEVIHNWMWFSAFIHGIYIHVHKVISSKLWCAFKKKKKKKKKRGPLRVI